MGDNNWYVYRHIRIDKNEPFYIGIGNKLRYARAYEKHPSKRNEIWNKIVSKTAYDVEILFDNISKEEASIKEIEFIKLYGRKDINTGILCNMTDGGDGISNCNRTEATRMLLRMQKIGELNPMYGKKQSMETLIKRGVFISKPRSIETKIKQSIASVKSGQAKRASIFNAKTDEFLGEFHSMSEALRNVGLCPIKYSSKASLVARGKRNHVKGFKVVYTQ